MQSYIALITLLGEGGAAPGVPTHPIAPGGPPPGYWGGVAPPLPTHPIAPGGPPPRPAHPIVIPPGSLAPGVPTHPIVIPTPPVEPTHPIVIPPDTVGPGVPSQPIYIPGRPAHPIAPGGSPGAPTHPIVVPPVPPTEATDKALVLVVVPGHEPVWFILDANDGLKPTHPQPKSPVTPVR